MKDITSNSEYNSKNEESSRNMDSSKDENSSFTFEDSDLDHNMVARGGSVEAGKKTKRSLEKEMKKAKKKQKKAEREKKLWQQALMSKLQGSSSEDEEDDGIQDIDYILATTDGYDMEKDVLGFKKSKKARIEAGKQYRKLREMLESELKYLTAFEKSNPTNFLKTFNSFVGKDRYQVLGEQFKMECLQRVVPQNVSEGWNSNSTSDYIKTMGDLIHCYSECFVETKTFAEEFYEAFNTNTNLSAIGTPQDVKNRNFHETFIPKLLDHSPEEIKAAAFIASLNAEQRRRANQDPHKVWSSANEVARFLKPFETNSQIATPAPAPTPTIPTVMEVNAINKEDHKRRVPHEKKMENKMYWRERNLETVARLFKMSKEEVQKAYGAEIQRRSDKRQCVICETRAHRTDKCYMTTNTLSNHKKTSQ